MRQPPITLEVGATFRVAGEVVQVHSVEGSQAVMLRRGVEGFETWPVWLLMVLVVKHVAFTGPVEPLPEVVRFKSPHEQEETKGTRLGALLSPFAIDEKQRTPPRERASPPPQSLLPVLTPLAEETETNTDPMGAVWIDVVTS